MWSAWVKWSIGNLSWFLQIKRNARLLFLCSVSVCFCFVSLFVFAFSPTSFVQYPWSKIIVSFSTVYIILDQNRYIILDFSDLCWYKLNCEIWCELDIFLKKNNAQISLKQQAWIFFIAKKRLLARIIISKPLNHRLILLHDSSCRRWYSLV